MSALSVRSYRGLVKRQPVIVQPARPANTMVQSRNSHETHSLPSMTCWPPSNLLDSMRITASLRRGGGRRGPPPGAESLYPNPTGAARTEATPSPAPPECGRYVQGAGGGECPHFFGPDFSASLKARTRM